MRMIFGAWLFLLACVGAFAEERKVYKLVLKDHLFFPAVIEVPADTRFKLVIENQDESAEEFDSFDLNREKVIFGFRQSTIYLGPLKPGDYEFFGEYHSSTARGTLVAVEVKQGGNHAD